MKQLIKHILREQTGGNYKVDEFPFGDFIVFVGKNAESNEYLTFELADEMDLWFHAKDYPGSHVVLSLNGLGIPLFLRSLNVLTTEKALLPADARFNPPNP